MLYDMYDGKHFLAQGAEFNSYALQAFADTATQCCCDVPAGAFVYKEGDYAAAKAAEADSMVLAVRKAVDLWSPWHRDQNAWASWAGATAAFLDGLHHDALIRSGFRQPLRGGDNHNPAFIGWAERLQAARGQFLWRGPYGKYLERWKEVAPR